MEKVVVSTKGLRRSALASRHGTTATAMPMIPVEVLLEIAARSDAATVVRLAATCKLLRRAMREPAFRRRVALRDGLFLGVSYAFLGPYSYNASASAVSVGQARAPRRLQKPPPFDAGLLDSLEPVASRRGLHVLRPRGAGDDDDDGRRRRHQMRVCTDQLRVYNDRTGQITLRLPLARLEVRGSCSTCALLTVDDEDAGRSSSFKLLVADRHLRRMQTFSTEDRRWSAAVKIEHDPAAPPPYVPCYYDPHRFSNPVVLGGTAVYWLHDRRITALDSSAARAASMELPPGCRERMRCNQHVPDAVQLATSADGTRLSLLVAEVCMISVWTLSSSAGEEEAAARWSKQLLIWRHDIVLERSDFRVQFFGFGELSGCVVLRMPEIGLIQINLRNREVLVLKDEFKTVGLDRVHMCLHETDLPSLLLAMKDF